MLNFQIEVEAEVDERADPISHSRDLAEVDVAVDVDAEVSVEVGRRADDPVPSPTNLFLFTGDHS